MNRILVEVYLPVALKSFDIWIPTAMRFSQATELVARALARISNGLYQANQAVLCDFESGEMMNVNLTVAELGLQTGSKLLLM